MGVMQCDRKGCENVCCDRYSTNYGYICNSCFEELCDSYLPISIFMTSNKEASQKDERVKEMEDEFRCI